MSTFMDYIRSIEEHPVLIQWLASMALLGGVVLLRALFVDVVRKAEIKSADLRRRWLLQVRNICFVIVAIGFVIIWASELRTMAISVAAVIVAIVLALKELIICVTGGFYKVSNRPFSVGDRIQVGGMRGDVIDQTLLATKVLEVGPGETSQQRTGRSIVIPNSLFLTTPIINEVFMEKYVLHTFRVPMKADSDWKFAERSLLSAAREVCAPFLEQAVRRIESHTKKEGLESIMAEPRVSIALTDPERIDLVVRVPALVEQKGWVEQQILRRYLSDRIPLDDNVNPPATD